MMRSPPKRTPLTLSQHLLWAVLRVFALLPLSWLQRLGQLLGLLSRFVPNEVRRVTKINITHCFPELSPEQQRRLVHKSIQHTFISGLEMIAIWMKPPSFTFKQINCPGCLPPLPDIQGALFLVPHIGAWEVFPLFACQYYYPDYPEIISLYRPPKQAILEGIIRRTRERISMTMVPTTQAGVKALYKGLDQGKVVAILPDQDPGQSGGVFAPFFGIDTWTMTLVARLAKKANTKVYFTFATRNAIGKGYAIHTQPASEGIYQEDIKQATIALNKDIEAIVRQFPEQYQWSYKRFKRQPDGKSNFYDAVNN